MVLWNFDEATSLDFLSEIPHNIFSQIVNHPHLNANSEFHIFLVINRWLEGDLKDRLKFCLPLLQCLRTDNLSVIDMSKMLDYESVKKSSEANMYINAVLEEKRHENDIQRDNPTKIRTLNCRNNAFQNLKVGRPPRQLPVVPCVVGRINPKPGEKLRQKDFVPHLFVYKNKELVPYLSLQEARVNASLTQHLINSLNSQGYQITSIGPVFYVTGGEFNLGKSNWTKYVWKYNTINSKWDLVCDINILRYANTIPYKDKIGMGILTRWDYPTSIPLNRN